MFPIENRGRLPTQSGPWNPRDVGYLLSRNQCLALKTGTSPITSPITGTLPTRKPVEPFLRTYTNEKSGSPRREIPIFIRSL